MACEPCSQHLIFFMTYSGLDKLELPYAKLEKLSKDKYSSLLGPLGPLL